MKRERGTRDRGDEKFEAMATEKRRLGPADGWTSLGADRVPVGDPGRGQVGHYRRRGRGRLGPILCKVKVGESFLMVFTHRLSFSSTRGADF